MSVQLLLCLMDDVLNFCSTQIELDHDNRQDIIQALRVKVCLQLNGGRNSKVLSTKIGLHWI